VFDGDVTCSILYLFPGAQRVEAHFERARTMQGAADRASETRGRLAVPPTREHEAVPHVQKGHQEPDGLVDHQEQTRLHVRTTQTSLRVLYKASFFPPSLFSVFQFCLLARTM
jgi:hypothetical protein